MRTAATAFGVVVVLAAGCGGDDSEDAADSKKKPAAPATVLKLAVDTAPGRILFDKKRLTAPAGRIRIELSNSTRLGHNVRIQTGDKCCFAPGHKDLGGTPTDVGKVAGTVNLKPGRYFFLCSLGGHWQRGQRGTLVVQ